MFIVIELQTYLDETLGTIVNNYEELLEAQSKYYSILSAAALSKVPIHAAVLLDEKGNLLNNFAFEHMPTPEENE